MFPLFKKGRKIRASSLNKVAETASKKHIIKTAGDMSHINSATTGSRVYFSESAPILAKITGGTNPYSWIQVVAATGGAFDEAGGGLSGTTSENSAYEINGNDSVDVDTIVVLKRHITSMSYFFCHGSCS